MAQRCPGPGVYSPVSPFLPHPHSCRQHFSRTGREGRGVQAGALRRGSPLDPAGSSGGVLMAGSAASSFEGSENTCRLCVCVLGAFGLWLVCVLVCVFGFFLKVNTLSRNIHSLQDNDATPQTSKSARVVSL